MFLAFFCFINILLYTYSHL
uniref:Uncharacterized protein n=1 Tax=Arundo donax TaxID=35708 RepID=A0A0A9GZQ8_ARUDO